MIFVEFFVRAPQGTMIGTVLTSGLETLDMSAFVGSLEISVSLPVLRVISGVAVVIVVRESRYDCTVNANPAAATSACFVVMVCSFCRTGATSCRIDLLWPV